MRRAPRVPPCRLVCRRGRGGLELLLLDLGRGGRGAPERRPDWTETARITFKRNGVYDKKGLEELDWVLRDWRNNQATTMSPELFDLLWALAEKAAERGGETGLHLLELFERRGVF